MNVRNLIGAVALSTTLFASGAATSQPLNASSNALSGSPVTKPDRARYAFAEASVVARLDHAFATPTGYTRVEVATHSYEAWLRTLPLRTDRVDVRSYKGAKLGSPSAAIVAIDVGAKNLQQCADSAIRLHAEYLWSQGRHTELAYHFTSGDEVRFTDWLAGERIAVKGSNVRRLSGPARKLGRPALRSWLDLVFMFAGTRSLHRDSVPVQPADVRPGDFFVAPGGPGHAVVVLDVATRGEDRVALIGQGFMPAQDFHVLRSSTAVDGVWFELPDSASDTVKTPSWRAFRGDELRRFTPR